MILLTLLITTLIARKKAKSNSNKVLVVSANNKTKTSLQQYVEWLQNTDTVALRARLAKN
ncbi:MAG: hypothetical protein NTY88_04525 [Bacteroidetes bacterium]|nr:hypothetical protein [Bacteroidota bacterium]